MALAVMRKQWPQDAVKRTTKLQRTQMDVGIIVILPLAMPTRVKYAQKQQEM